MATEARDAMVTPVAREAYPIARPVDIWIMGRILRPYIPQKLSTESTVEGGLQRELSMVVSFYSTE